MRRAAAGWPPVLRLLTPLILALGALVAPVECTVVPGPHSLFGDPAALAALAAGGPSLHPSHVDAVAPEDLCDPRHEPAAPAPERPASSATDDGASADLPTPAPLTAPGESTALVAVADIGDPIPVAAGVFSPAPEPVPLAGQAAPALEPPPPRAILA